MPARGEDSSRVSSTKHLDSRVDVELISSSSQLESLQPRQQQPCEQQLRRDPSYDDYLIAVGHRHWYQAVFMLVIGVAVGFPSMQIQSVNFTMLKRPYVCDPGEINVTSVPQSADVTSVSPAVNTFGLNASSSGSGRYPAACWVRPGSSEACQRFAFNDTDDMSETVIESFGLVCSWEPLATVVKVTFMLGFLFGSTCFGLLSDRWGRRNSFHLAGVCLALTGVSATFVREVISYSILRFLAGFSASGLLTVCFTWHTEMLHSSNRFVFTMLMKQGWSCGIFLLTAAAYATRDWRLLELLISSPVLLLLFSHFFLVESPRWLLQLGRTDEATGAFRRMAVMNRRVPKLDELLERHQPLRQTCLQKQQQQQQPRSQQKRPAQPKMPILELLKRPATRAVAMTVWLNFAIVSLAYYSLSLNWSNFGIFGSGAFTAMALGAAAEVLARFLGIPCGIRVGRVRLYCLSMGLAGAALIATAVLQAYMHLPAAPLAAAALALAGRSCLQLSFELIWLYASEVFPTPARNSAIGVGSTAARVGGVLAPEIALLARMWTPLPLLVCGCVCLVGCLLAAVVLPETRGRSAPDTLEEAEQLVVGESGDSGETERRQSRRRQLFVACCCQRGGNGWRRRSGRLGQQAVAEQAEEA